MQALETGHLYAPFAGHLYRSRRTATPVVLEEALADLLSQGSYEAHLRRLTTHMHQRRTEARRLIAHHFPNVTRVSNPPSGDTLWVELAPGFSSMELFRRCAAEGITFGPGELFTATDRYRHCLGLNFSDAWTTVEMQALARIGEIAGDMLAEHRPTERRRA